MALKIQGGAAKPITGHNGMTSEQEASMWESLHNLFAAFERGAAGAQNALGPAMRMNAGAGTYNNIGAEPTRNKVVAAAEAAIKAVDNLRQVARMADPFRQG